MRITNRYVVVLTLVVLFCTAQSAPAEIKMGTLPRGTAAEMEKMYSPLAEYLSKETGEKVSLVVPPTFAAFKDAAIAGKFDVGFANPLIYVEIKHRSGAQPLALSSEIKSGSRIRGIMIARKDSGIAKIPDLKGKKLIFMEKDSAAGYVFQMLLLDKAGLDTKKDFQYLPFGKTHENVTKAVFDKTADAGGIREDELEKLKDKVDVSQLRVIGYTDYFPNWPMFATSKIKPDVAAKIRTALLKLKPNDPQNDKILASARLTGFIPVSDQEYEDLKKAAKLAGIIP